MYLGDGYISRTPRTYRLEVSLHKRQGPVIERVARAISALRPGHPVGLRRRETVTIVNAYSNAWPTLFPQHGTGRKHQRPIVLQPWQRSIVEQNPQELVRGCIESDGCRHRRVVAGRDYSNDILGLFVWACSLVGLRPRRANRVTVSRARRGDVAALDKLLAATDAVESPVADSPLTP